MKLHSLLGCSIAYGALSSASFAAQFITFPSSGPEDTEVTTGWTRSDPGGDRRAFYDTIGTTPSVAVGAFYDDYAGVGTDFFIEHALPSTIPLSDAALSWNFTISDSLDFPERNDFFFTLLDSSSTSFLNVLFSNAAGTALWNVSINGGSSFTAVEAGFNYTLDIDFTVDGADVDYVAAIDSFSNTGTILGGASEDVTSLRIGETLGSETVFGDAFISVNAVPEPGTMTLFALFPSFCLLRRRR